MLLVDHREAELGELGVAVEQRVRADEDVDLVVGEALRDPAALGRGRAVGEQLDAHRAGRRAASPPRCTVSPSSIFTEPR